MELVSSQAAENNKGPIGEILSVAFADCRRILEIASGTGQHAVHMARLLPEATWQPSDLAANLAMIGAYVAREGGTNVLAPVELDVSQADWPVGPVDGVFAANAVHIMSWRHVVSLFAVWRRSWKVALFWRSMGPTNTRAHSPRTATTSSTNG